MRSGETHQPQPDVPEEPPEIQCTECASAHRSPGRNETSFLLLDALTVPVVGCSEHLEQFRSVCGHTTTQTVELLDHWPAGGISCPGCRLAPHNPYQPMIPVGGGMVAALACPTHQSEIVDRFHTGLQTRQQITASPTSFRE
jgi:hypothetical protein